MMSTKNDTEIERYTPYIGSDTEKEAIGQLKRVDDLVQNVTGNADTRLGSDRVAYCSVMDGKFDNRLRLGLYNLFGMFWNQAEDRKCPFEI